MISNGPYYLESYSPESRAITVREFKDDSYPFKIGQWKDFEQAKFPTINKIDMKNVFQKEESLKVFVQAENSDSIIYFLINSEGNMISSKTFMLDENNITINIPSETTKELGIGANNIKIFAISNSVLKPDFYESGFIVTESQKELPDNTSIKFEHMEHNTNYWIWIIPIGIIVTIIIFLKKRYYIRP